MDRASLQNQRKARLADVWISGSALVPVRPFVERFPGGWDRLLQEVAPASAALFDNSFVATARYPFSLAVEIVDLMVELAPDRKNVLREFAIFNLDFATNLIFRAIFKVSQPGFMIARSNQVWRKYYSEGSMTAEVQDTSATVQLHDFPLTANYDILVMHSLEAVLLKAGARQVRCSHAKCVRDGDPYCEYKYTWRAPGA